MAMININTGLLDSWRAERERKRMRGIMDPYIGQHSDYMEPNEPGVVSTALGDPITGQGAGQPVHSQQPPPSMMGYWGGQYGEPGTPEALQGFFMDISREPELQERAFGELGAMARQQMVNQSAMEREQWTARYIDPVEQAQIDKYYADVQAGLMEARRSSAKDYEDMVMDLRKESRPRVAGYLDVIEMHDDISSALASGHTQQIDRAMIAALNKAERPNEAVMADDIRNTLGAMGYGPEFFQMIRSYIDPRTGHLTEPGREQIIELYNRLATKAHQRYQREIQLFGPQMFRNAINQNEIFPEVSPLQRINPKVGRDPRYGPEELDSGGEVVTDDAGNTWGVHGRRY